MTSRRVRHLLQDPPPLVTAHLRCAADRYQADTHPDGYINFGTAENTLIENEIAARVQGQKLQPADLHYNDPAGSEALRHACSDFLHHFLGIEPLPPNQIVVASGVSALLESLAFCLLDAGDAVMTLSPVYSGFWHDFEARFDTVLRTSDALDGQRVDLARLGADLDAAPDVRALLLCNPHNPLGICLHPEDLGALIALARDRGLDLISDEIYANSVFGDAEFVSALDPRYDALGWGEHIHQLYGLAKDFGLSGFKTGFFASRDAELARAMAECAYFHTVSGQTQRTATELLRDTAFCASLFATGRARLAENFAALRDGLDRLGIHTHPSHAGVFTMIELGPVFGVTDAEQELQLFQRLLDEARVNITPGQFFAHPVPGWFRVCYAQPLQRVDVFLDRLGKLL